MTVETYGRRRVPRMIQKVNRLREVIRNQGTPDIQSAWDDVEQIIDFAFGKVGAQDNARPEIAPAD